MRILGGIGRRVLLYVEVARIDVMKTLLELFKDNKIRIIKMETEHVVHTDSYGTAILLTLRLPSRKIRAVLKDMASAVDGVICVEEVE